MFVCFFSFTRHLNAFMPVCNTVRHKLFKMKHQHAQKNNAFNNNLLNGRHNIEREKTACTLWKIFADTMRKYEF